jgi:hypothetical protein
MNENTFGVNLIKYFNNNFRITLSVLSIIACISMRSMEATPSQTTSAWAPMIAKDGSGNIVAIWQAFETDFVIQGATMAAGEAKWGPITTISAGFQSNQKPSLAVNARGDAIVLWSYNDGINNINHLACSVLTGISSKSSWSSPYSVTDDSENVSFRDQRVQIDDRGNISAIWSSTISDVHTVRGGHVTLKKLTEGTSSNLWTLTTLSPTP